MQKAFSIPLPIKKLDAAAGLVTGWAALSTDENGQPIIDWENHHISVEELTKATHKIMLKGGGNNSKDMHEVLIGDIVEAMVFSKEKTKALGLGDSNVEGLAVTLRLHDPKQIAKIRSGARTQLSIHGVAKHIPIGRNATGNPVYALQDILIDEISIVDAGASGNGTSSPRIVIAKRKPAQPGFWSNLVKSVLGVSKMSPFDELLARLSEEDRNIVLQQLATMQQPAAAAPAPLPAAPLPPVAPLPLQMAQAPLPGAPNPQDEELKKALAKLPEEMQKRCRCSSSWLLHCS